MRRRGIVVLAIGALLTISAVSGADTKAANTKKTNTTTTTYQPVFASAVQTDSPLVRAAKISLQSRLHPKSRIIIDSNTLVVSRWTDSSPAGATAAPTGEARGRTWESGNSNDAAAIAAKEKNGIEQRAAAERARQEALKKEQSYMASQDQEPYAEVIDDHVTKRLEEIPPEMKQKPPM